MKKIIRILLAVVLGVVVIATIYLFTDPSLPSGSNAVISEIIDSPIPELINGENGYVSSGATKIWYESKNSSGATKGSVLLINGFMEPSTSWNQTLINLLIDAGYQVIRFDNRDVGLSEWTKDGDAQSGYDIDAMKNDAIVVLDELGIEKSHVVGYSMGGYIAQKLAIENKERVLSLTCLSSTANFKGDHPDFNWAPASLIKLILRYQLLKSDESFLKYYFMIYKNLNSNDSYPIDLKSLGERGLYELHKRRGFNPNVGTHQGIAIGSAEPLDDDLHKVDVPALVVHGKQDPILSFELAKDYSSKISDASTVWIDEAGHMITNNYVSSIQSDLLKMLDQSQ